MVVIVAIDAKGDAIVVDGGSVPRRADRFTRENKRISRGTNAASA
jgi:hypothetical protein